MATNIQQNVLEVSSTPAAGQPWNFHGILESYLLPRVVASDSALLPGARLLWAVIRQHSWRDGRCTLSDQSLARAVGVQWRQCVRYCRQLEKAGLLRTTARAGKTPVRELLWDARFAGKIRKPPVLEDSPPCLPGQPPLPSKTGVLKEVGSSQVGSRYKTATIEKTVTGGAPSLPAPKAAAEWSEEDYRRRGRANGYPEHMIERDIERMRARLANAKAERMIKAAELKAELESSIPR